MSVFQNTINAIIVGGSIDNTPIGNTTPSTGNFTVLNVNDLEINDTSMDDIYIFGVSELTANRTVTLPVLISNDTFVFEAHAQSLTNKIIIGSTNTVEASGLLTTGSAVTVSTSAAPTAIGFVLETTSSTAAAWDQRFKIFMAVSNVLVIITGGFTPIPWNVEQRKDFIYTHSLNSTDVTVGENGDYLIIADVSTDVAFTTARSESTARLMVNTGGGFIELIGSRTLMYNRRSGIGGTSGRITWFETLSSGNMLRMEAQRDSGTDLVFTLPNYCRFFIKKL